jgi:hypothetical protein
MAARKKAKVRGRPKARGKKAPARKPARRAKPAKKPVRKKAPGKARRSAVRPAARPMPAGPIVKPPPGLRVGVVTHYFSELAVAVVKLDSGMLRVGDNIHIRGHTSDFAQRVDSIQVNRAPVMEVGPNDDFGIKVRDHAREHDVVYKVK